MNRYGTFLGMNVLFHFLMRLRVCNLIDSIKELVKISVIHSLHASPRWLRIILEANRVVLQKFNQTTAELCRLAEILDVNSAFG